ncbi:MAG: hypothetical protein B6D55_05035 [Candidatus Omnitrophica bacterium 4484_70.2]|nr:MAG: hypothetical protein B6D55_05035 [Candidatus Omnitrophica bacterium 4484_70.2]
MLHNLYLWYLKKKYGEEKLKRLKERSFPYVGNVVKLAKMDYVDLIKHLKKVLGKDFKAFFKKSISLPTVEERLRKIRKEELWKNI